MTSQVTSLEWGQTIVAWSPSLFKTACAGIGGSTHPIARKPRNKQYVYLCVETSISDEQEKHISSFILGTCIDQSPAPRTKKKIFIWPMFCNIPPYSMTKYETSPSWLVCSLKYTSMALVDDVYRCRYRLLPPHTVTVSSVPLSFIVAYTTQWPSLSVFSLWNASK